MKNYLSIVAVAALLAGVAPAFGAPKDAPKTPAKPAADPLDIPAFAPIPNEFVFAGTRKDAYKLLSGYTKGFSLELMPTPTLEQIAASKEPETLQAIANVKNLLEPIHVLRVRSLSYRALGEEERRHRGYESSQELLANAETFYQDLMVKQGGKVQTQLSGETSITVYAFETPRTFAVITRGPSRVIVARADGKPDVGAITGIFTRVVGGN